MNVYEYCDVVVAELSNWRKKLTELDHRIADALVVEVDIEKLDPLAMQRLVLELGRLPEGQRLSRITSYNVCYTKLLRYFCPPS